MKAEKMAMLAERKAKKRFSKDPRNTAWLNDTNKIGERMLKEMGWTKGKGLGANEDGNPDFVRLNMKEDNKGVGFTANDEDKWIAHQDDFNKLLNDLNQTHSTSKNDRITKEQVRSLEKQSKASKKRVHYHKFTRGKDLSLATINDMACILGNRKSLTDSTVQLDSQDVKSADSASHEEERNKSVFTSTTSLQGMMDKQEVKNANSSCHEEARTEPLFTSTMSLQEYFSKKMDELKKKSKKEQTLNIPSDKTVSDCSRLPELPSTNVSVSGTDALVFKKKKKGHKTKQSGINKNCKTKSTIKCKRTAKRAISNCQKSKEACCNKTRC